MGCEVKSVSIHLHSRLTVKLAELGLAVYSTAEAP